MEYVEWDGISKDNYGAGRRSVTNASGSGSGIVSSATGICDFGGRNSWQMSLVRGIFFSDFPLGFTTVPMRHHAHTELTFADSSINTNTCHYILAFRSFLLFAGNLILYTKMAVEILGGWQDSCAHHGLRHRHLFRSREKTKKEITFRLFVGKFKVSTDTKAYIQPY